MRSLVVYLITVFITLSQIYGQHNLFPNGGAENTFVNQTVMEGSRIPEERYRSHIEANREDALTYWKLSEGATISVKEKHIGKRSVQLTSGKKEVKATVQSDFWKVKDGSMPFGLPLVAGKVITVSFYYKTKGITEENALKAKIKLGVIKDLPSREIEITLSPSSEWKLVERKITLDEIKWGGKIIFTLIDSTEEGYAWIDDAYLGQDIGNGINLVKNHSFEKGGEEGLPKGWRIPLEDQWVSWVGAKYRQPVVEENESISGGKALRATVTYTEGSGVSQLIPLHQKKIKPIAIDIWSKLDNSTGKKPYSGYYGPGNYSNMTIYVYHTDGTMQEVNPTFCLGESDHDWDYRRFGFQPTKPIKEILLQITLLGSEPTTSLFVDDVRAYEIGTTPKELEERGIDYPRYCISSVWGKPVEAGNGLQVNNDEENLYINIPKKGDREEIYVYLNTQTESKFVNHYRYLFDVVKIDKNGKVSKGITVEKQGFTADGEFRDGREYAISLDTKDNSYLLTVPYKSLQQKPEINKPFGFNVLWQKGKEKDYWHGKAANNKEMGRILLSKAPNIRIKSIEFGKRYYYEEDLSQNFISHPQLYAGLNEAVVNLLNEGEGGKVEVKLGIEGEKLSSASIEMKKGEEKEIVIPYEAGVNKLTEFEISVTKNGITEVEESYPIIVPPAIEIIPDQEYYYSEEGKAAVEINNRYRPMQKNGKVKVEVKDLTNNKVVDSFNENINKSVDTLEIDIIGYRVNELPVQDYLVTVTYYDDNGNKLCKAEKKFGKINHTKRRKLPPIKKLTVDEKGRVIINDNFRFFPIVPSVNVMDWDEAINMGANIYRIYTPSSIDSVAFFERDRAWEKNVYTLTIGPFGEKIIDEFEKKAEDMLVHPGFFSIYSKQFYYWNLPPEYIQQRKRIEQINSSLSSPRLIIWGHHDSSFLYDIDMPEWQIFNPLVGYCYVKIMGRPGSVWRNSPFLTRTEMVLNPHRFKLAEVNYYVAFHADEIVPEHFKDILSLRGDDWHGVRNETYQAIIDGANGVYHWVCTQKKDLQRLRGWFQELNFMWPIYVADDAGNKVEIIPSQSTIAVQLKKWEGKYYLLAANRDETSKTVSIRIDGFNGMKVKKLFELKNELSVKDNVIRDRWNKYDVHVYEIEIDN